MNEQTATLLEQLANKLGTTSEYLWEILLRQAPIDATVTLIQYALIILFSCGLWKAHNKLMREPNSEFEDTYYEEYPAAIICMVILAILWLIFVATAFFYMDTLIAGYFNPEYWALQRVLEAIN